MTKMWSAFTVGCAVAVVACAESSRKEADGVQVVEDAVVACADHQFLIRDRGFLLPADTLAGRRGITTVGPVRSRVPEWHDCQRFIEQQGEDAPIYGQLIAIFASDVTMPLSAITAVTIAVIYNYDYPYDSLGIDSGWNCLYAIQDDATSARAWMVPVDDHPDCDRTYDPNAMPDPNTELRADAVQYEDLVDSDYPQAARWDYDPESAVYYIGIKCAQTRWCRIYGHDALTRSRDYTVGPNRPKNDRRRIQVKGWYDEQILAVPSPGANLRPSMVTGTTFPAPDLDQWDEVDFAGRWIPVGTVYLEEAIPPYESKLGLRGTGLRAAAAPGNDIWICDNQGADCPDLPPDLPSGECSESEKGWCAKIYRPFGPPPTRTVYRSVKREEHGEDPPATSRWHWLEDDEKLWFRCGLGCCQM